MTHTLITHQDAPTFSADDTTVIGYASPARGATSISLWRIELAPGSTSPLHEIDVEEVFLGLQGSAVVTIGGRQVPIGAGDCLVLPPQTAFTLAAAEDGPFLAVACMPAAGKATLLPNGPTFVPPWAQ